MQLPSFAHTLTKLPDGRILAVGGKDMRLAQRLSMDGSVWSWASTNTAEIYDPATNAWTLTAGRLNNDRAYHAAQLLPTGQVLIVGGYHADLTGNISWPTTVEIFDPTTGTFSVMDTLQYGLSEPQAALLCDGRVFLAGQIQPPMEAPPASQQGQNRMIHSSADLSGAVLSAGSAMAGTMYVHSAVTITGHNVLMTANRHSAIRICPTNQKKWINDSAYGQFFKHNAPDSGGNRYMTLSRKFLLE